jgi:Xaa-Pro aminopeptidase/uncharacterized NAD(P)/FAD-binding protein YdhS
MVDDGQLAYDVLFVGAGPRAVSTLERLVALYGALPASERPPLRVALVDPFEAGRGRTWRADQDRLLLNNSSAAATTMFADESVPVVAPLRRGPAMDEWARTVVDETWPAADYAEARSLEPWMQPSRVLQGSYYRWVLDTVVAGLPEGFTVTEIRSTASRIEDAPDGSQRVHLADGPSVTARVVVLAQGFVIEEPDAQTLELSAGAAAHGLTYLPPAMAQETDWSAVPAGEDVIVRGLAATFFDVLGLLYEGRGGRFTAGPDGLRYIPSGQEPRLLVGSRSGLPKRAQHPGLIPTHELTRLTSEQVIDLIAEHGGRRDLDWAEEIWPRVLAEIADAFNDAEFFDWNEISAPTAGLTFTDRRHWQSWTTDYLTRESVGAQGAPSPWLAARAAVLAVRTQVERLERADCFTPESALSVFHAATSQVTSGPPAIRFAQFAALCRQGFVELIGPDLTVEASDGLFRAASPRVPGSARTARTLIDAFFPFGDLDRAGDPLVHHLRSTGLARLHGETFTPRPKRLTSYDIDPKTYALRDAGGRANPARIVVGLPGSAHQRGTGRSAIPGTGDRFFADTDRVAVSVFEALGLFVSLPVNPNPDGKTRHAAPRTRPLVRRISALQVALTEKGVEAAVFGPSADLRYFTGIDWPLTQRTVLLVVPAAGQPVLVLPSFEISRLPELPECVRVAGWDDGDDPVVLVRGALSDPKKLGVGSELPARLLLTLNGLFPQTTMVDAASCVAPIRIVKDDGEIQALATAAACADRALRTLLTGPLVGQTESALAGRLAALLLAEGLTQVTTMIAAGANGGNLRHRSGDTVICSGEPVFIDLNGAYDGYQADVSRVVVAGDTEPDASFAAAHAAVQEASTAAFAMAAPGVPVREIDLLVKKILQDRGLGEYVRHRAGHGIGLELHEGPDIEADSDLVLRPGMTFAVQPGVYLPGRFGVRIEDVAVVTGDGCRKLNQSIDLKEEAHA